MSGHNKWAQIKHKKAITDAKKAKIFSKISRIISVAVKEGGSDPQMNQKLKTAIEKAKSVNMPADNIERAMKKGAGEGKEMEEIAIEAYGPFGVTLIIEAITDNKNRTMQEIRNILTDFDGKMAGTGAVRWMFDFIGTIEIKNQIDKKEQIENIAIENDAMDIKIGGDEIIILTAPEKLHQIKSKMEEGGVSISDAYLGYAPKDLISLSDEQKRKIENLCEALDENDDVQEIYLNIQ